MSSPVATSDRDASASRLGDLLRAHYAFAWRCVRRFGVAERDVDDVVQEVFVVVSTKLDRIEIGKERAFVTGTAIKLAANRRRSQRRAPELREFDAELEGQAASMSPSAEELVEQKRRRILLDRALDALSLELRAPFVLSEVEGLSRSETAELLGLPEGTVATRVRAARKRFEAAARQLMRGGSVPSSPGRGGPDDQDTERGDIESPIDGSLQGQRLRGPDKATEKSFEGQVSLVREKGSRATDPAASATAVSAVGVSVGRKGQPSRLEGAGFSGTGWGDESVLASRCVEG